MAGSSAVLSSHKKTPAFLLATHHSQFQSFVGIVFLKLCLLLMQHHRNFYWKNNFRQHPGTLRDLQNQKILKPLFGPNRDRKKVWGFFCFFGSLPEHRGWSPMLRLAQESSLQEGFLSLFSIVASFSRFGDWGGRRVSASPSPTL